MGAVLLGSDIAVISEHSSLAELMRLDRERLTDAIARQSDVDDMAEIEQIMNDFWHGMVSGG